MPLLFLGLGLSFLDPDEGLYGAIAQEMLARGDWVLPRFNGLPYLEKPPLYFWLASLGFAVTGPTEWSLRAWSALGALGSALLAWRLGRLLYGARAGLMAGLALVTMAGSALYVRKASTDFLFVFCMTLAMWGFVRDADRPDRGRGRFLLLYVGAGLAVLTKGLVGLLFPVLIVAITVWWVGRRGGNRLTWRQMNLGWGLAALGAVALPWHLASAWREPELFWFYLMDNQVLRFLGLRGFVEDDVPVSTVGFLLVTFVWLFPWGVFLLARSSGTGAARLDGMAALPRDPGGGDASAGAAAACWRPVLVIWALVVVGFFAFSRSTLEYYALPAFPALAVLVGGAWASGRDIGRWLGAGLVGSAAVGAWAIWLSARLTPAQALDGLAELNVYYRILRDQGVAFPFESAEPFARLLGWLGATLIVGWALAALCWARGWRRAAFGAVAGVGVAIAVLIVQLLHVVEPHHSARPVARAIVERTQPGDVIAHEGPLEYSAALPFYTGRRIVVVNGARGDLDFASRRPEARGYFLDGPGLSQLWDRPGRVFLVTQLPPGRSVVSGLPPGAVRPIGRFGSRWLYSNERM